MERKELRMHSHLTDRREFTLVIFSAVLVYGQFMKMAFSQSRYDVSLLFFK